DLTADHIVPLAAGGAPFDIANCAVLCRSCNSTKGASEGDRGDPHAGSAPLEDRRCRRTGAGLALRLVPEGIHRQSRRHPRDRPRRCGDRPADAHAPGIGRVRGDRHRTPRSTRWHRGRVGHAAQRLARERNVAFARARPDRAQPPFGRHRGREATRVARTPSDRHPHGPRNAVTTVTTVTGLG
ncbi:MAG: HNH endonuclease, partial [Chloroflexi bacterium]|nr:HNH endonuclease [Chloroflexota bacterium]